MRGDYESNVILFFCIVCTSYPLCFSSERRALEVQIQEFGQTPRQIFFAPHPSRRGHGDSAESSAAATVTVDTANRAIENAETNGATSIEVANINNEKDVSGKMQVGSRIGTNMVAMLSKTRLGKAISSSLSGTKDASSKGESAPASTMVVATESVEKTSGEISIPVNDKDVNDESIVELGKDFEIEVERALRETQTATASSAPDDLTVAAQVSAAAPLPTPSVGSWVGYLRSGTSGEILSASKANLNIAQSSGRRLREATNLILHGVEQMKCHSDAVAAISFSSDGRIVSSCSKDSTMKVLPFYLRDIYYCTFTICYVFYRYCRFPVSKIHLGPIHFPSPLSNIKFRCGALFLRRIPLSRAVPFSRRRLITKPNSSLYPAGIIRCTGALQCYRDLFSFTIT